MHTVYEIWVERLERFHGFYPLLLSDAKCCSKIFPRIGLHVLVPWGCGVVTGQVTNCAVLSLENFLIKYSRLSPTNELQSMSTLFSTHLLQTNRSLKMPAKKNSLNDL